MKPVIISMVLLICATHLNAQLGSTDLGKSAIGNDSLYSQPIGNASIEKCVRPGPCNSVCSVYTFSGSGNWSIEGNWEGGIKPPTVLSGCIQIVINPGGNNECLMNVPLQIIPSGASIIIMSNKKFRIPGKLIRE